MSDEISKFIASIVSILYAFANRAFIFVTFELTKFSLWVMLLKPTLLNIPIIFVALLVSKLVMSKSTLSLCP